MFTLESNTAVIIAFPGVHAPLGNGMNTTSIALASNNCEFRYKDFIASEFNDSSRPEMVPFKILVR